MSSAVVKPLASSPAIVLPATFKPLSGPNIVPPHTPTEQTVFVLLPSSSLSITSPLLAQKIPTPSNLLSNTVVKPLASSLAISLLATLKLLSGPNIVLSHTLAGGTASVLLLLSSLSMTSFFLAQGILATSILLSGVVVEPFIPSITQSTSLTLLLDLAIEFLMQGRNQCQSTSIPAPLLSPSLDLLEKPANRLTIEPATNLDPDKLHLDSLHDKNIASLLKALAENVCNTDKDIIPARKKKTLAKDACNADEDVSTAGKKKTRRKVALLSDRDIAPAGKIKTWGMRKLRPKKKMCLRKKKDV